MKPKDQDPQGNKSEVIYSYPCGNIACCEEYIGQTSRTLDERYKEHLKQSSPIYAHSQQHGHNSSSDNFNIIGREDQGLARTIKEAICIRVNNPTLNRNIGKYNLNHIWDRVLFNTPGLKIGSSYRLVHIHNKGHAQSNPRNGHLQINIGHCGHALNSEHVLRVLASINKCSNARLFSDLMNFTVVNESLSKQSTNVLFWRKIY